VDAQENIDHKAPGQETEKPDLRDILDQDQQNAQRSVTPANEAHHVVRDDAVHMVARYETSLEEATPQTVTMDVKIELTHHVAEYNAMHMDTKYEIHLEEEGCVDTYMNNADSPHQQDVTKTYPWTAAVSTTDDAQHRLM
jgi:phosphoribosylaminoimidazole-succinocarboxamide synthase